MRIRIERRPRTLAEWIALVPLVILGLFVLVFSLAFALLLLLCSPVIAWWHGRQRRARGPRTIDVEYEIRETPSEE